MEERYIKNLGTLTEQECALLREKRVLVAGCGGLGGYIIEMLLRVGIGYIVAVDGDAFEPSNLNRQLLCDAATLGTGKAAAAKARAKAVNPDTRFVAVSEYISASNADTLISGCDAVVDALDNIPSRRLLAQACSRSGIPYIYGAVSSWIAQAAVSMPGDSLIERLYPDDDIRADCGSAAFTPALCASLQSSLCVKQLCGRNVEHGRLYFFDMLELEFEKL